MRLENIITLERRLVAAYGRPRHGNKANPMDELVYIVLSRQTNERNFARAYQALRRTCRSWRDLRRTRSTKIEAAISSAGFGQRRAKELVGIARQLETDFGSVTLAPLRRLSTEDAEQYLTALPGIGRKSARCILMYSLERDVFPVDVHCFRVLNRLGFIDVTAPIRRHEDRIQELIPPSLRYSLHVTLVALGRDVCHARTPECGRCVVASGCRWRRNHVTRRRKALAG